MVPAAKDYVIPVEIGGLGDHLVDRVRGRGWVLGQWNVLVDGLDLRFVIVGCFREGGGGDSDRRGGNFCGHFVFKPD